VLFDGYLMALKPYICIKKPGNGAKKQGNLRFFIQFKRYEKNNENPHDY
jgi:hypothetical protein